MILIKAFGESYLKEAHFVPTTLITNFIKIFAITPSKPIDNDYQLYYYVIIL